MHPAVPRDEELLERGRRRFPGDEDNRKLLTDAVDASALSLGEMFGAFLVAAGVPRQRVAETFDALAEMARTRELRLDPEPPKLWRQVSDAVTLWWRDPEYLDFDGQPRDLPECGPTPSLQSLLEATVDADLRADAKVLLRRAVATERGGLWHFEEDNSALRLSGHHGVERLMLTTSGMLSTFLDNQLRRSDPVITKNFDRTALVPDFPVADIPALRAKLIRRLELVLTDIDHWMMERAKSGSGGPVTVAGLTMLMHTGTPRTDGQAGTDQNHDASSGAAA